MTQKNAGKDAASGENIYRLKIETGETWSQLAKRFNLHGLGPILKNQPNWIQRHYQWLPTNEWKRLFKADHVYLSFTLDTIAVIKRHQASH